MTDLIPPVFHFAFIGSRRQPLMASNREMLNRPALRLSPIDRNIEAEAAFSRLKP
jgi:hypothetical protein